jgi:tetratricopeptide (TPR) repeat protein
MKKLNNEDHPLIASLLFGKSELMRARRKPEKAHALLESALVISRKIYRSNHPFIATCLNSLAEILRSGNSFDKAGPLYQKALFIYSKIYNNCDHPSITDVCIINSLVLIPYLYFYFIILCF